MIEVTFPDKLQFLFQPKRYKVLYGGRGGAKSWGIARALLLQAKSKKLRILCVREFQGSMRDSVHKLLADQIDAMGLSREFEIFRDSIICTITGSEFIFEGIKHNVSKIKSMEGIDICWVEEAQAVTDASWKVLSPTIRKEGSEIWVSFNPDQYEDTTYQMFVVHPPADAIVQKVNWKDNPWFPEVLKAEMLAMKTRNYDEYLHIWEGECKKSLDGAVYAQELRDAREEGRITKVPYDPTKAVDTFWDLGHSDSTVIWFAQVVGFEFHIIDYYENNMQKLHHYVEVIQRKPYIYGIDWLPHDAKAQQLGTHKSIQEMLIGYQRRVRIVPKLRIFDGINAARTVFPNCYFDEIRCKKGLDSLYAYKYAVNRLTGQFSKEPQHDEHSHAADAFRYLAVSIRRNKNESGREKKVKNDNIESGSFSNTASNILGWMGL